jgi:choice-of-anchor C domain-containing protein
MKTNALSRRPTASYRPRLEVLEDRTLLAINLLSNGSFENGPALDAFRTVFAPSAEIDGWTVTRGSVDHISSYWTASDGARSLDLDGLGPGTIGQTFVTVPGQAYDVTLDMAANPDGAPSRKILRVSAAGTFADFAFDGADHTHSNMGWQTRTWAFTATSSATTLQFFSLMPRGSAYGPALDRVSVTQRDSPVASNPGISGQWASAVVDFSSQWSGTEFSAAQTLGEPDSFAPGGSVTAWAPGGPNSGPGLDGVQRVTLRFPAAVNATGAQVHEVRGNGFVRQIDFLFIDDQGNPQTIGTWTGEDPSSPGIAVNLLAAIPRTADPVNAVTVHINIDRDSDWEHIDAVKLLDGAIDPGSGPTDISLSNHLVSEDATSVPVGTLSAADPSSNETFSYQIIGGALDFFFVYGDQLHTRFPKPFQTGSSYLVEIRAFDADGFYVDKTFIVEIADLNDAPQGADREVSVAQGQTYTFSPADFGFSDPDDSPADQPLAVIISSLIRAGDLKLRGSDVTVGQVIPWSELGGLSYTAPSDLFGTVFGFTFAVRDDGGTIGGGKDTDPTPKAITIQIPLPDVRGQWAHRVVDFSTQWSADSWGAKQVLGPPDTPTYGDFPTAWTTVPANSGGRFDAHEHITVQFRKPVYAVGAVIRETLGNGYVEGVDFLFVKPNGRRRLVATWNGIDPSQPGAVANFTVAIPKTASVVNAVRVRINIDHDPTYWEELDAIRLLGDNQAPTDVTLSNRELKRPARGALVGTLTAADVDSGEKFRFTLVGGAVRHFQIVDNRLRTSPVAELRPRTTYAVWIRATDRGGLWVEKRFDISIGDTGFAGIFPRLSRPM